jgi:3-hydroxyacyl-[acyl-carrier-protein] dehydratase
MTNRSEIESLLPHRKPFLFVDNIEVIDNNDETGYDYRGSYTFSRDEDFFRGHFPGHPVVPGVILAEVMAQVGGAGVRKSGLLSRDSLFMLASIEKLKLRREVRPEEMVISEITNLRVGESVIRQSGRMTVNGELAADAIWMCMARPL